MIIAVDFDGTLCKNEWPDIGVPNDILIHYLQARKQQGDKLILWTCRTDQMLDDAIAWCTTLGLTFDAINDNLPESKERFCGNSRKIFADLYIDDRAHGYDRTQFAIFRYEE